MFLKHFKDYNENKRLSQNHLADSHPTHFFICLRGIAKEVGKSGDNDIKSILFLSMHLGGWEERCLENLIDEWIYMIFSTSVSFATSHRPLTNL